MDLSAVKQRITTLRGSRTKKEFAGLLGFTPSYLSQIENQEDTQKPSIEALFAISDACDVSIDYILTGHNYASKGMATNQSFVGLDDRLNTPLAKGMYQTLHQLRSSFNTGVKTLALNVQEVDRIGNQLDNLKALEGTSSALSVNSETAAALRTVKDEMVTTL